MIVLIFLSLNILFIYISYLKYNTLNNPLVLFTVIFFLHNWAYTFVRFIGIDIIWIAPIDLTYSYMDKVFVINIINYFSFVIIILLVPTNKIKIKLFLKNVRLNNVLVLLYIIMTFIYVMYRIDTYGLSFEYGFGQAKGSAEAFSPIERILSLRIYIISFYFLMKGHHKNGIQYIFIELIVSILFGGRKALFILIISYYLNWLNYNRINFKLLFKSAIILLVLINLSVIITNLRTDSNKSSNTNNVILSILTQLEYNKIIGYGMISANSEGVQNWTYKLLKEDKLDNQYGRSYLQAIINSIVLRPFQGDLVEWQGAYKFKSVAYPGVTNQGWDFSFTAEAMMNWGRRFAFVSYLLLAIFISFIYKRTYKPIYYLLYMSIWPTLFIYMRSDSTAIVRTITMYLVVYLIIKIFQNKNKTYGICY